MPALPQEFLKRMSELLGAEFRDFFTSYEQPRTNGLRVNTLKITPAALSARDLFALEPIPWAPDGFYYDYTAKPGQHPYHAAGVYYLQEPSAMAVVYYLDPQPGEWILDLAAAPGGKSTQIASRLMEQGLLWANEINPGRTRILAQNLDRWGASNIIVSNESPDRLAERLGPAFDRILLDAPCSGEGMFRKDPEAMNEWSPAQVRAAASRQSLILKSAVKLLKPGGRLVYSTCTFAPEENEEIILRFLESHPEFKPLSLPAPAAGLVQSPSLPSAVRLYPHKLRGEGHFIAVVERSGAEQTPEPHLALSQTASQTAGSSQLNKRTTSSSRRTSPSESGQLSHILTQYRSWAEQALTSEAGGRIPSDESNYTLFGPNLYLNPAPELPLSGLSILRPGLHLGTAKPGRFQPGQSLALTLSPSSARYYLSLGISEPRLKRFLHGESWEDSGPDGWVLVGVDEFPLGWAKRTKGQLKNHYPKDWRVR